MSIQVTLIDNNDNTSTIVAENGATFKDILHMDTIADVIREEGYDVSDYEDYLISINDTEVTSNERLRDMLLEAEAKDGDTIELDVELPADEEEVAEELGVDQTAGSGEAPSVTSAVGHVIVMVSGGIVSIKLAITPGKSTVAEVLANGAVKARSGMTDAQIAQATVKVRGTYYETEQSRKEAVLDDGTVIEINPRQASNKG